MPSPRDVLTPDSLAMLQAIAEAGSFAAAARQLGLVPRALTYRVRQIEDALDVLLFDRRSRHAQPTEAGLLVTRQVARPSRNVRMHYAWSCPPQQDPPRALQWWLQQLESPATRRALMENHHRH